MNAWDGYNKDGQYLGYDFRPGAAGNPDQWNGAQYGAQIGQAMNRGIWFFSLWYTAKAAQRHYEITGDWHVAWAAAKRAFARWLVFTSWLAFFYALPACILPLWVPVLVGESTGPLGADTHRPISPSLLISLGLSLGLWLMSFAYCAGTMWIRNADRSLQPINFTRRYKFFLPFAYRMRRVPDWLLYLLPFVIVLVCSYPVNWALS